MESLKDIKTSINSNHNTILDKIETLDQSFNNHRISNSEQISTLRARSTVYGGAGGIGVSILGLLGWIVVQNKRNGKVVDDE